MPYKPLYITVEGIDGCGKTTAVEVICNYLEENDVPYKKIAMIEQGPIRELLLNDTSLSPWQRVALFATAAQNTYRKIDEALASGCFVVSDRGIDSFYAYQGFGEGSKQKVEQIRDFYGDHRNPDLTFFLSASIKTCQERMLMSGKLLDMVEQRGHEFYEAVLDGYNYRIETTNHIKVIDAENKPKRVALDITIELDALMENILA